MNTAVNILRRQSGSGFSKSCDSVLTRLAVHERDSWNGITPSLQTADFNPSPPILAAKFAKCAGSEHILAIANEDGKIAIQNTNEGCEPIGELATTERALEGEQCHLNAVFDIEWAPGEMKLVSASGDHTARLWTMTEAGRLVAVQIFNGHSRSVKTASFRYADPAVFATGGRDGVIILWDIRAQLGTNMAPRADSCIFSGHAGGPGTPSGYRKRTRSAATPRIPPAGCSSSITGLAFQDDNTLISCGAGDGIVKVWDVRRHYSAHGRDPLPKQSFPYAGRTTLKGFTNLAVDHARNRLYVNCMDHHIYCYNLAANACGSSTPMAVYGGLKNGTFYIKSSLSPDGRYLISGSSDEKCYIWNVDQSPEPLVRLTGHTVEVTSVAWMQSEADIRIVTCSDDARHKIWRIGPEHIDIDEAMISYRGRAEYCESYRRVKSTVKSLECTPRSVKRLVERNETTPSTGIVDKRTISGGGDGSIGAVSCSSSSKKRTFTEMEEGYEKPLQQHDLSCQEILKRPNFETRGRRLFSPAGSTAMTSGGVAALEIASSSSSSRSLHSILEESEDIPGATLLSASFVVGSKSPLALSDMNLRSPPAPSEPCSSASTSYLKPSASATTYSSGGCKMPASPTLNLPNYVLDGDAPHLTNIVSAGLGSPGGATSGLSGVGASGSVAGIKRKLKENVDWLTKIRKQKLLLLQAAKSTTASETEQQRNVADEQFLLASPRLQQLRSNEDNDPSAPRNHQQPTTPPSGRRRTGSRSDSTTAMSESQQQQPKTPTGRRRNSTSAAAGPGGRSSETTSILRFLTSTGSATRTSTPATSSPRLDASTATVTTATSVPV